VPTLPYHVVDVFTDRPFAGNQLAVVLDADDLPTTALQDIAREFRLSETAFPLRSDVADYRLRIFTPVMELPFAGHPSVGTAWLLAQLRRIRTGSVTQECGVGVLPVEVTATGATLTGGPPIAGGPVDPAPLLPLLGLGPGDVVDLQPRVAGCGVSFLYLPVPEAAVGRLHLPDETSARPALAAVGAIGVAAFAWAPAQRRSHARVFVPGVGEDPATGAAAVGFGVYLAASGLVSPDGETSYTIDQGAEMERPSRLECTVSCAGGAVVRTTVAGSVVQVATGELLRPARSGSPAKPGPLLA
jgi:trans-2,3-dihydro-3-hydroxyanthranilate isomerase